MAFFTRVVGRHGHGHHRAPSGDSGAGGDADDHNPIHASDHDHDPLLLEHGTPPGAAHGPGSPRAAAGVAQYQQQQQQRRGAGTPSGGVGRGGGGGRRGRAPLPHNPLRVAWRVVKAGLYQFALLPSAADALGGGSPGTATTLVAVVLSSPQVYFDC